MKTVKDYVNTKMERYVHRVDSWKPFPNAGDNLYLDSLDYDTRPHVDGDIPLVELPYCMWGDYVGGTVERANHTWILEEHESLVQAGILWDVYGGFYSHTLMLRMDADVPEELEYEMECLADTIAELYNYPLANDDVLHEIEQEILEESLDSWILDDLRRVGNLDEKPTAEQFYQALQDLELWECIIHEDAVSVYIRDEDLARIAEHITLGEYENV